MNPTPVPPLPINPPLVDPTARAEARIDLGAIRDNVSALVERCATPAMIVVKADAYGHGLVPCARAAQSAGAAWLGVALPEEALALRAAGVDGRVLVWLCGPGTPWSELIGVGVDVAAGAVAVLDDIAVAAGAAQAWGGASGPARVHLKVDTGLGRGGATPAEWPAVVASARRYEADGLIRVVGVWSHLACADTPRHESVEAQIRTFTEAVAYAQAAGVEPEVRHLANSPAALLVPRARFDLVRLGLAAYGLSPAPAEGGSADFGIRPAMTLSARVALVKRVPAGHGVSYGHLYHTDAPATLTLVPVGYADGIPVAATNKASVLLAGKRRAIAGRVAMDQFVVDLGDDTAAAGDEVVLFGPGDRGEPTAEDWARAVGTISYEIVTRIGPRVPRIYVNEPDARPSAGPVAAGAASAGARG